MVYFLSMAPSTNGRDAGVILTSWETWDHEPVERSQRWYAVAGSLGVAALLHAVITGNYLFALIILMFAALLLVQDMRAPRKTNAYITDTGVVYDGEIFPFTDLEGFALVYRPPVKMLYLSFNRNFQPTLAIPLLEADPVVIRENLLGYLMEDSNLERERLTDTLHRVYKL
jgi:hypothetical protein